MVTKMLQGECKTAGGKLAMISLVVENDKIAQARLFGDFFVHPEPRTTEIIQAIETALNSLPATLEISAIASHIMAAIPFGVELLGTSSEAIAIAVKRAISGNPELSQAPTDPKQQSHDLESSLRLINNWKNYAWRLIPEQPQTPQMNVALDEVLLNAVARNETPPTLRFWRWSSPAVIVGRCQSIENEVDQVEARKMGVQIVRRMTGGGAMFLQPHGAITYSLYLPEEAVAGLSIRQSYEVCESWIIAGLRELGVDAHHVPINDIACSAGKIGGAAQARRNGVVLHHTTMAYDMDPGEMVRVLRIGREKLRDKAVTSAQKRVSPLVMQTGLKREQIANHLFQSFQNRFGGHISDLTETELDTANMLIAEKYGHTDWTNEIN